MSIDPVIVHSQVRERRFVGVVSPAIAAILILLIGVIGLSYDAIIHIVKCIVH